MEVRVVETAVGGADLHLEMTRRCCAAERGSAFLQPGTQRHSLCSPGSDVAAETFELRPQIRVSYGAAALAAVKRAFHRGSYSV